MYNIAILKGDGIGPEIIDASLKVLDVLCKKNGIEYALKEAPIGGEAIDVYNTPFPDITKEVIDSSDAILLGAVGGPKWDGVPSEIRPEKGLLSLRQYIKAYCNIRPITGFEALKEISPIKNANHIDLCFIRELTGGIYFGDKSTTIDEGVTTARDVMQYNTVEVRRIAKKAFEFANQRKGHVTSVDKSNVLSSSKLWRTVTEEVAREYKIPLKHMYVDNAAMQLILNPGQFDVILTSNMFGDILSDEASVLVGSIGVLPSVSIGDGIGLYEPIHGSAPDIAGMNIANPIGMVMSVGEMFRYSFKRPDVYDALLIGINKTLLRGYGTKDLPMSKCVTTTEWIDHLIEDL
jgi:3-isopropylmalate dehydrogenase